MKSAALILLILLAVSACTSAPVSTETSLPPTETILPTLTPTPTPTQPTSTPSRTSIPTNLPPTATITPAGPTPTLPPLLLQSCLPADSLRQTASVLEVIDASKIRVRFEDGVEAIVRYLGIDPPQPGTAGALQAAAYNRQLADGQSVTLLQDITYQDADETLPRYVLAGDIFINAAMLHQGYARHAAQPPDVACVALFRRMTQAAFDNFSGLWGMGLGQALAATASVIPGGDLQSPNYGRLVVPTPTRGSPTPRCDPAYPTICIPPPPPYLNCGDIPYRNFVVLWPDPHDLDGRDRNGIGCERPTATP